MTAACCRGVPVRAKLQPTETALLCAILRSALQSSSACCSHDRPTDTTVQRTAGQDTAVRLVSFSLRSLALGGEINFQKEVNASQRHYSMTLTCVLT